MEVSMIKIPFQSFFPMTRENALLLSKTACQFESLITLEKENVILNAKSMLGLLSHYSYGNENFVLVLYGNDEKEASEALLHLLHN